MSDDALFCMCCGELVPVTRVERDGRVELNCINCGFTLDSSLAEPEAPHVFPCIIAVDDAAFHRSVLKGLLERSGLAEEIVALHGGAEFVSTIAQRFAEGLPVDMVILDVEMPAMDGFTAARFLRSLEAKLHRPPCPLIFFTGRKADDNLRRQMAHFRPVWYCAKGADADQAAFERRAAALIAHIAILLAETA
jgi:CheY-like chemotaxis protein